MTDPIVQILDCNKKVVRKDQFTDWVCNSTLTDPHGIQSVTDFDTRFPRTKELTFKSVWNYHMIMNRQALHSKLQNLEDRISDDELELSAAAAVDEHFGAIA
jgi:hypothetical protein